MNPKHIGVLRKQNGIFTFLNTIYFEQGEVQRFEVNPRGGKPVIDILLRFKQNEMQEFALLGQSFSVLGVFLEMSNFSDELTINYAVIQLGARQPAFTLECVPVLPCHAREVRDILIASEAKPAGGMLKKFVLSDHEVFHQYNLQDPKQDAGSSQTDGVEKGKEIIRCNNCMRIFASEEELYKLVEIEYPDGKKETVPFEGFQEPPPEVLYEHIQGCPECMTDGYLMDMVRYDPIPEVFAMTRFEAISVYESMPGCPISIAFWLRTTHPLVVAGKPVGLLTDILLSQQAPDSPLSVRYRICTPNVEIITLQDFRVPQEAVEEICLILQYEELRPDCGNLARVLSTDPFFKGCKRLGNSSRATS